MLKTLAARVGVVISTVSTVVIFKMRSEYYDVIALPSLSDEHIRCPNNRIAPPAEDVRRRLDNEDHCHLGLGRWDVRSQPKAKRKYPGYTLHFDHSCTAYRHILQ
jgi:hypothetical protein